MKQINLAEMNGKEIKEIYFDCGSNIFLDDLEYKNPKAFLQVEYRNGDMAEVPMFFVIVADGGEEKQRYNYLNIQGVVWA